MTSYWSILFPPDEWSIERRAAFMRRCHTIFMARRNFFLPLFFSFFAVAQLSRKSKSYYYYFDVRQVRHGTVVVRSKESEEKRKASLCVCGCSDTFLFFPFFHVDWNKRVWHKSTNQLTVMAAKKRLQQTNTNHFFPPKQTHNSQNQIQTVVLFPATFIKFEDIFPEAKVDEWAASLS